MEITAWAAVDEPQIEKEVARFTTQIVEAEVEHSPTPPLERRQVEAALETIGANLHLIYDETEDPTIVDLKESVRVMNEKIVVLPQKGRAVRRLMRAVRVGSWWEHGLWTPDTRSQPTGPQTQTPPRLEARGSCI